VQFIKTKVELAGTGSLVMTEVESTTTSATVVLVIRTIDTTITARRTVILKSAVLDCQNWYRLRFCRRKWHRRRRGPPSPPPAPFPPWTSQQHT
jgi:hypothetical protein